VSAADIRLKVLKAVRTQRHRYVSLRFVSMAISLLLLSVVPLIGLARVDFWGGEHRLLFQPAPFKHGLAGVIIGIGAMYVVTFLSNVAAGRMFCGWGCPVGQVSRFGEAVDTPGLKGWPLWRVHMEGAAFSAAFVVSVLAWWVDLRVLVLGSPRAMAIAWGLVAFGVAGAYVHGRFWRWEFCKTACPIGLYYTFMSPAKWYGVHFRNQQETCIECDACDRVCPVSLTPRDLLQPIPARGGLSLTDAPGRNHCLECGDCIRACEFMVSKKGKHPAPLLLGYYAGPQSIASADAPAPADTSPAPADQPESTRAPAAHTSR
jgi:polyferredoxin